VYDTGQQKIRQTNVSPEMFLPSEVCKIGLKATIFVSCLGPCCWFIEEAPSHPRLSAASGHKHSYTQERRKPQHNLIVNRL